MGNGTTIQIWSPILELKIMFLDIHFWIVHKELLKSQRELKKMTFKPMDMHQRPKFYIREIKIQLAKDLRPVASTEAKLDHMLRLQVKPAAVSIQKVL